MTQRAILKKVKVNHHKVMKATYNIHVAVNCLEIDVIDRFAMRVNNANRYHDALLKLKQLGY